MRNIDVSLNLKSEKTVTTKNKYFEKLQDQLPQCPHVYKSCTPFRDEYGDIINGYFPKCDCGQAEHDLAMKNNQLRNERLDQVPENFPYDLKAHYNTDVRQNWSMCNWCLTITLKPDVIKLCGCKNRRIHHYVTGRLQQYCKKHPDLIVCIVPEFTTRGYLHYHGYLLTNGSSVLRKLFMGWCQRNLGHNHVDPKRNNWETYIWKDYPDMVKHTPFRWQVITSDFKWIPQSNSLTIKP